MLQQLDRVNIHLEQIQHDFADRLQPILNVVYSALVLASCVHQLTVVDNEISIASTADRRRFLKKNRSDRTKQAESQDRAYQETADGIWREHPDWSSKPWET